MNAWIALFGALIASPASAPVTPTAQDAFAETWFDGRAELCGYRWRGERYGEPRNGEAVAIFVTEPFDVQRKVKADDPRRAAGEVVTALKLNLIRDFQTGLYDYNTMTSVFVRADDLAPLKASFSSAEWCGHVYEELDFRPREIGLSVRSYFQGESTEARLERPAGGLVEDQLFVWLRGLHEVPLEPGETLAVPFLPGPFERRLRHAEARWGSARVSRSEEPVTAEVPAGRFDAREYRIEAPDGRRGRFWIEVAAPQRVLSWEWTRDGVVTDAGELCGSSRRKYWQEHDEGQERLRTELGLD